MARGGYRPGAGRPKGAKTRKKPKPETPVTPIDRLSAPEIQNESDLHGKIQTLLDVGQKARAKLLHDMVMKIKSGGKLTASELKTMGAVEKELAEAVKESEDHGFKAPLEYMLAVMNDPRADADRRDRMAISAAAYVHARPGAGPGKKQNKEERAKKAGNGRFATSSPPKLTAVK